MFARTPEPPYVAVVFTSVRTTEDDAGYAAMGVAMDDLARQQPGYLGIESARGADGVGITVSYWATEADASAWRAVTEHREAQRLGMERWYEGFCTRVATVHRARRWERATG